MITISRILHPTDLSKNSKPAFHYAGEFALHFKAELHLLNIVDTRFNGSPAEPEFFHMDFLHEYQMEMQKQLQKLTFDGIEKCTSLIRKVQPGIPYLEIPHYAEKNGIDIIIMGTHGRTGMRHLLIGSVAENVVRRSRCPVLTISPEEK